MRKLFQEKVAEILKEIVDLPTKKIIIHINFLGSTWLKQGRMTCISQNCVLNNLTVFKLLQFLQLVNV